MSSKVTLGEDYRFSTIVQWYGRVNYTNMELINIGTFTSVSGVPALVQTLEAIRPDLPESLQSTDFRSIEYYTFREATYSSTSETGATYKNIVIPAIFITNGEDGMTVLSEGQQPTITIDPSTRADFNLVTGTLRDLDIKFEINYN